MGGTTYLDVGIELDQLSYKVNSGDIRYTGEPSCCLAEGFHHRRTIACITLLVHFDPLLNIAWTKGRQSI
jgi:hypothetical protein